MFQATKKRIAASAVSGIWGEQQDHEYEKGTMHQPSDRAVRPITYVGGGARDRAGGRKSAE
jgi:hypothetical protein